MAINKIDSRIRIKRSTITGATPTIGPSTDHMDGTWSVDDIYVGELYANLEDDKLWVGTNNGPKEVTLIPTGETSTRPFQVVSGTTNSVKPTFGTNTNDSTNAAILGGSGNDTNGFNNLFILGNSITASKSNATYVDALMNEDNGTVLRTKIITIGDWNMDTTTSVNVAHGLSATEWKTIRVVQAIVRNDADTAYTPVDYATGAGVANGAVAQIDATNIILTRVTGGNYDSTAFDSTGYNRGWVTLEYTPD